MNGIDIKQSSNTVNSVIPGVTLQLLQQSDPGEVPAKRFHRISSAFQFRLRLNTVESDLQAQQGQFGALGGNPAISGLRRRCAKSRLLHHWQQRDESLGSRHHV